MRRPEEWLAEELKKEDGIRCCSVVSSVVHVELTTGARVRIGCAEPAPALTAGDVSTLLRAYPGIDILWVKNGTRIEGGAYIEGSNSKVLVGHFAEVRLSVHHSTPYTTLHPFRAYLHKMFDRSTQIARYTIRAEHVYEFERVGRRHIIAAFVNHYEPTHALIEDLLAKDHDLDAIVFTNPNLAYLPPPSAFTPSISAQLVTTKEFFVGLKTW